MKATASSIVSDGEVRARRGARREIQEQVSAQFARRLESSRGMKRLLTRWQIRREVSRRLKQAAPTQGLYFCSSGESYAVRPSASLDELGGEVVASRTCGPGRTRWRVTRTPCLAGHCGDGERQEPGEDDTAALVDQIDRAEIPLGVADRDDSQRLVAGRHLEANGLLTDRAVDAPLPASLRAVGGRMSLLTPREELAPVSAEYEGSPGGRQSVTVFFHAIAF
jgi:hypothetical protein